MPTRTPSRALTEYNKEAILKALRHAQEVVLEKVETHEEALAKWREEAPKKFAEKVAEYQDGYHFSMHDFEPPYAPNVCKDWRVQGLSRLIARFELVAGDTIKLRADDEAFNWIGNSECM